MDLAWPDWRKQLESAETWVLNKLAEAAGGKARARWSARSAGRGGCVGFGVLAALRPSPPSTTQQAMRALSHVDVCEAVKAGPAHLLLPGLAPQLPDLIGAPQLLRDLVGGLEFTNPLSDATQKITDVLVRRDDSSVGDLWTGKPRMHA
jgi:hypothetical protein